LAIRRHRLPRFWLAITLGLVTAGVGTAWWWEAQLPGRLERAAATGRYDDCLRYSEQLAALRWMTGRAPREQGRCRRAKAASLWAQERFEPALKLQLQLVNSAAGTAADRVRLTAWQEDLKSRSLARFEAGDLEGALALLRPMGEHARPDGTALGDNLREYWGRNRLQQERARKLVAEKRWWEALDALNRIDHPWWKSASSGLRQQVTAAIEGLRSQEQEHHSHGSTPADSVPIPALDAAIRRHVASGLDEWTAFTRACGELGGKVVEAGPETSCRR
jgi:tetratricopeptide (TPR) repeat protein